MTAETKARPACMRLIWVLGKQRPCGQDFALTTWTDESGALRAACRHHRLEVMHRYPELVPA